jgi:hypothetical protein
MLDTGTCTMTAVGAKYQNDSPTPSRTIDPPR